MTKYFGRRNMSSQSTYSCEYLPINTNFESILLLVFVLFSWTASVVLFQLHGDQPHPLFPYFLMKLLPIPTSPFSYVFSGTCLAPFFFLNEKGTVA